MEKKMKQREGVLRAHLKRPQEKRWQVVKKKREGSALKHQKSIFGALNLYRPSYLVLLA